ncbi:hypothetical protein DFP74_4488 [Nocardiopsis sp. Huas11]|uniref:hypothetical protein n=1 Tax=Nocardiopsis sp. Huas11 TaxID=2183912 RepID=UPI000EB1273F|nr:hypothetical protein [Nocardiopsis sp. Huas11]RKS08766.1 hypothetical protein DFP74_4488 [Nocardiopsis sp. Huas11]
MPGRLSELDAREVLGDLYDELVTPVALGERTFDDIVEEVVDGALMVELPLEIEVGEFGELARSPESGPPPAPPAPAPAPIEPGRPSRAAFQWWPRKAEEGSILVWLLTDENAVRVPLGRRAAG